MISPIQLDMSRLRFENTFRVLSPLIPGGLLLLTIAAAHRDKLTPLTLPEGRYLRAGLALFLAYIAGLALCVIVDFITHVLISKIAESKRKRPERIKLTQEALG